jgi:predicted phage terminase large subunit-like protein
VTDVVLASDPFNPPDWEEVQSTHMRIHAVQEAIRRELASRHLLHFTQYFSRDYTAGWVHEEVAELLMAFIEAIELKRSPRLIIQLPPRVGKSELVSRSLPPFILGKHPEWEVVTATYNQDLANDFGRDVRSRLRHPVYQGMFPATQIRADSNAIDDVRTEQNGSYRAVGVGGALTGRGAHCIAAGSLVTTARGAVPIEEVVRGDLVVTHLGRWRRVSAVYDNGVRGTIKLTAGDHVLRCTSDHRVYVDGDWVEAGVATALSCATPAGPWRRIPVWSTTWHGPERVYDLSVEEDYSFVASGVVVHNCLLIDDPVKNREDADSELVRETTWKWWQSVARTRLAPGGGVIVCLTRWHEDDLAGKMLQQQAANPDGSKWMLYSYPAIATQDEKHRKTGEALHPERWPLKELHALRADMDPREWSALYQQNPTPPEGIAFKREWVKYATPPAKNVNWYISTDFAIGEKTTNDRTVIWPFAVDEKNDIYFGMPIRDRMSAERIVDAMCDTMERTKPVQVVIENVHISKTIGPFLKRRMHERRLYVPFWEFTASKDKLARASSLQGRMQQGRVFFHPDCKHVIEEEFIPFPAGRHDDAVDAASVGMLLLDRVMSGRADPAPKPPPPPAWSSEWIKERSSPRPADENRHVPRHLNGRARKPKSKAKTP